MADLNFWSTGDDLTTLFRAPILEGRYAYFRTLLESSLRLTLPQASDETIEQLLFDWANFKYKLSGDSRTEEGIVQQFDAESNRPSWRSINIYRILGELGFSESHYDVEDLDATRDRVRKYVSELYLDNRKELSNLKWAIHYHREELGIDSEVIVENQIAEILEEHVTAFIKDKILEQLNPRDVDEWIENTGLEAYQVSGIILEDGRLIALGYDEHRYVQPILARIGLADDFDYINGCNRTIHISSGEFRGNVYFNFINYNMFESTLTQSQVDTVIKLTGFGFRGFRWDDNPTEILIEQLSKRDDYGKKRAYLEFIKRYLPEINIPTIHDYAMVYDGTPYALRTSLTKQYPGLLNSVFGIRDRAALLAARAAVEAEISGSEHVTAEQVKTFIQDEVTGANGVAMYDGEELKYAINSERGAIVGGKLPDVELSETHANTLTAWAEKLYKFFEGDLQIEFTVDGNTLWLLELKVFKSLGDKEVTIEGTVGIDIASIQTDGTIDDLYIDGKRVKGLLIEEDTPFSHIASLARSLKIPVAVGYGKLLKHGYHISLTIKNGKIQQSDEN